MCLFGRFLQHFLQEMDRKNSIAVSKRKRINIKIRHEFGVFFCKIINCIDFFSKRLYSNFYQSILVQIHNRIAPFVNLLLDYKDI